MNSKQQQYIHDNHNRQTIGEMAEHLKLSKMEVLDYCDEQDFSLRKAYQKRAAPKEVVKEGFFTHDKNFGI